MKHVGSAANVAFKSLRRLVESSRERKRSSRSVLEGVRIVATYCEHVGRPEQLVVSRRALENRDIRKLIDDAAAAETIVLGDHLFDALSTLATPSGVLAIVQTPRPQPVPESMDCCVMLEDLQDPGNLGSILRSCAAAGVRHVLLSRGSVHAWSPRVLRAGMGAHFALSVHEGVDLAEFAVRFSGRCLAARPGARRTIFEIDLTGRLALVLGNEGAGLSAALTRAASIVASIPMPGGAESLNVAAAAAVCLFERVRQVACERGAPAARP